LTARTKFPKIFQKLETLKSFGGVGDAVHKRGIDLQVNFFFSQVCEGLAFLHDSVKMIHRNISLGCIILNEAGAWKIFGFDFCLQNFATVGQSPAWNFPIADQMQPASELGLPGEILTPES
jgi:SCY1-like protein 2